MPTPITVEQLTVPKASALAAKVLQQLSQPNLDFSTLTETLMQDPVLAGELIRYANSPLYRRSNEVTNVPMAVQRLGLKNIRSAVMTATLISAMPVDSPGAKSILDHLTVTAMLCKLIARECWPEEADNLEFMGLVHDLGTVVLATNFQQEYHALIERSWRENLPLDQLEQESFGISHDALAAKVCKSFRLPALYQDVLTSFHQREAVVPAAHGRERAILMLAHYLLRDSDLPGATVYESIPIERASLQTLLGLSDAAVDNIAAQASAYYAPAD